MSSGGDTPIPELLLEGSSPIFKVIFHLQFGFLFLFYQKIALKCLETTW